MTPEELKAKLEALVFDVDLPGQHRATVQEAVAYIGALEIGKEQILNRWEAANERLTAALAGLERSVQAFAARAANAPERTPPHAE